MKYKCKVIEEISNNKWMVLKEIKFNPEKHEVLSYKDEEVSIPLVSEMYAYEEKGTVFILWDIKKNEIVKLDKQKIPIDAKFLDKFLTTAKIGIVGQLVNAVHVATSGGEGWLSNAKPIIWLIIGGVFGFLAGGGVSG